MSTLLKATLQELPATEGAPPIGEAILLPVTTMYSSPPPPSSCASIGLATSAKLKAATRTSDFIDWLRT